MAVLSGDMEPVRGYKHGFGILRNTGTSAPCNWPGPPNDGHRHIRERKPNVRLLAFELVRALIRHDTSTTQEQIAFEMVGS